MTNKLLYVTPETEILDVKIEGLICTSGGSLTRIDDYDDGGDPFDF